MKKPLPIVTVDIDSLSHDGRGIGTLEGKRTFVHGALPSEKVTCQLTKKHSRYNEGDTLEVLNPAAERAKPACKHFGVCGGCSLQHMHADAQLLLKQNSLLEQLQHFGKVIPENIMPPLSGNPLHYRRKARLGVRFVRKKNKVLVGFREKSSNYLADLESCSVLVADVGLKLTQLAELIQSLSQFEQIPQIEVAVGDTETALIFRTLTTLPEDDKEKLRAFAKEHRMHFYLQPNPPEKIYKLWPDDHSEKISYSLSDYQLEMLFHPLDFIQINGEMNQLLLKKALELLQPEASDHILDLFCGLGNFTLPLARFAEHVTGVEGSQEMVTRAKENAIHNNINNVDFYAANLAEPNSAAPWLKKTYHKILLDPPRTGAKEILDLLPALSAKTIVYVSCNPATLARDAQELVYTHKYQLKTVGVVNMFPHTSHIEAIALFEK